MRTNASGPAAPKRLALKLAHLIVRIGIVLAEINYQQRRFAGIRQSADRFMDNPFTVPDTYAEFLLRTSGALRREPSAAQRVARRSVH
jgi:hypothetical protein